MKVVTYTTGHHVVDISPAQEGRLNAAGVWPKDPSGVDYSSVRMGLHHGSPSFSESEIDRLIAGESATAVIDSRYVV